MKVSATLLLSAVVAASATLAQGAPTNRYVVVFKSETLDAKSAGLVGQLGGKLNRALPQIGVVTASGDAAFAAALAKQPGVLSVGLEHRYSLPAAMLVDAQVESVTPPPTAADNLYARQWDIRRIGAPAAWNRLQNLAYQQPKVAVLDAGVMDDHPDLAGQVCGTKSTAYCSTSGGPGNTAGYPIYSTLIDFDAYPNWTPGVDPCTPVATSYEWHGTHVAGTIAAKFGGGRVVGVAPDACVGAYKVFDEYRYTDGAGTHVAVGAFDGPILDAIIDATMSGYPVISMSLGGYVQRNSQSDNATWVAWDRVMKFANRNGALIVASAGNEAVDLNGNVAHIPSDFPTVLSTSATGTSNLVGTLPGPLDAAPGSDVLAFYSNYGSPVDIAAPGGDCGPGYPATCLSSYFILNDYIFSPSGAPGYVFAAGTSMATPHVSAVAAYVRALHPTWTPGAVRAFLESTAQNIGPRQAFGAGMVDADAATQ